MKSQEPQAIARPARRYFIGGSDARIIMGDDEDALLRLSREKRSKVRPTFKRRGYDAITGRMPFAWSVIALCYATAAILLGPWPWNFLLLLLLFPSKRARFQVLPTSRSDRGVSSTCEGAL